MNRHWTTYFILTVCIFIAVSGCSTKKNTAATRSFHYVTSKYNINFNARNNYDKGIAQMQKSMTDDYSKVLPMYPISVHENGVAVGNTMDVVVEKCRKTIKLHSITKKPQKNPKKSKDPDYQHWYNKNEFNPQVVKAWLLLGQAEFSKADFIGAVGTFTYITKHYANEPAAVTEARIWMARAYAEMQWYYEAEEVLGKINENDVPSELNGLFAAAKADLLLKEQKETEAIPFLQIACDAEKNRYQRVRFHYILGQLLLKKGERQQANEHFRYVAKHAPNYTVEFNARMQMLTSETENLPKAIKTLEKMSRNPNNKDYLDQVYYALGNIYMYDNQKPEAIEAYKKAIEASTRNGIEKAVVLLTLGNIYYQDKQYFDAHPCYEEAATIVPATHDDYAHTIKLAETLGELAHNNNIVVLQDSLQHLSQLPEQEQRAIVDKIIAQIIADEEAARQRAADEEAMAGSLADDTPSMGFGMPAAGTTGEWYFYNQQLITSGRAQFTKRWGQRKLEDNWRRLNKSAMLMDDSDMTDDNEATTDSLKTPIDDNKNPAFYLSQIPKTAEQIAQSNAEIAEALLNMADIYETKLEDTEAAEATLKEYAQRFPQGERLVDCYYALYRLYGHMHKTVEQDAIRQRIVADFPDSKQAIILSQPDYAERVAKMYTLQDSLYNATYSEYSQNNFAAVTANYHYIQQNYPLSTLMPKFAFLHALSIGKTASQEQFRTTLEALVAQYPQSDVASMSKDILALMSQGKEAQQGTTSNLANLRQQELQSDIEEPITDKTYSAERKTPFTLMLIPTDEYEYNQLLFDLAAYNFSKFLVKDYDLAQRIFDGQKIILVSGFENLDETRWYTNLAITDENLARIFALCSVRLPISDENLTLVNLLGLDTYIRFYNENIR
ncbi:MAG: tetratricopeptide repeat protein [Paludibacteraceae bacterium]